MLADLSINEFLEKTASAAPLPGGGSAAALNAALGAALIEMVANLTLGRKGFETVEAEMQTVAAEAAQLRAKLSRDIDRDAEAYASVLSAYKLPKASAAEKAARSQAIQAAFQEAARVPLGVARDALRLMELARAVLTQGNPNAFSDAAAGVLALRMAVRSGIYNVRINLASIRDAVFVAEFAREARLLEAQVEEREKELLAPAESPRPGEATPG